MTHPVYQWDYEQQTDEICPFPETCSSILLPHSLQVIYAWNSLCSDAQLNIFWAMKYNLASDWRVSGQLKSRQHQCSNHVYEHLQLDSQCLCFTLGSWWVSNYLEDTYLIRKTIVLFKCHVKWKLLNHVWLFATPYTVHGILQARILEWVAVPFSRESCQPMDRTQVSRIACRFFTSWAMREAQMSYDGI